MQREHLRTGLRDRTLELLRALPRSTTYQMVAEATGLPAPWITAFARGEIDHPSVNRIQTLWEHLSGRELRID